MEIASSEASCSLTLYVLTMSLLIPNCFFYLYLKLLLFFFFLFIRSIFWNHKIVVKLIVRCLFSYYIIFFLAATKSWLTEIEISLSLTTVSHSKISLITYIWPSIQPNVILTDSGLCLSCNVLLVCYCWWSTNSCRVLQTFYNRIIKLNGWSGLCTLYKIFYRKLWIPHDSFFYRSSARHRLGLELNGI